MERTVRRSCRLRKMTPKAIANITNGHVDENDDNLVESTKRSSCNIDETYIPSSTPTYRRTKRHRMSTSRGGVDANNVYNVQSHSEKIFHGKSTNMKVLEMNSSIVNDIKSTALTSKQTTSPQTSNPAIVDLIPKLKMSKQTYRDMCYSKMLTSALSKSYSTGHSVTKHSRCPGNARAKSNNPASKFNNGRKRKSRPVCKPSDENAAGVRRVKICVEKSKSQNVSDIISLHVNRTSSDANMSVDGPDCLALSSGCSKIRIEKRMLKHTREKKVDLMPCTKVPFLAEDLTYDDTESELVCHLCGESFFGRQAIDRHMTIHGDDKTPICFCALCNETFMRFDELEAHVFVCRKLGILKDSDDRELFRDEINGVNVWTRDSYITDSDDSESTTSIISFGEEPVEVDDAESASVVKDPKPYLTDNDNDDEMDGDEASLGFSMKNDYVCEICSEDFVGIFSLMDHYWVHEPKTLSFNDTSEQSDRFGSLGQTIIDSGTYSEDYMDVQVTSFTDTLHQDNYDTSIQAFGNGRKLLDGEGEISLENKGENILQEICCEDAKNSSKIKTSSEDGASLSASRGKMFLVEEDGENKIILDLSECVRTSSEDTMKETLPRKLTPEKNKPIVYANNQIKSKLEALEGVEFNTPQIITTDQSISQYSPEFEIGNKQTTTSLRGKFDEVISELFPKQNNTIRQAVCSLQSLPGHDSNAAAQLNIGMIEIIDSDDDQYAYKMRNRVNILTSFKDTNITCQQCGGSFSTDMLLCHAPCFTTTKEQQHRAVTELLSGINKSRSKQLRSFNCDVCHVPFSNSRDLKKHCDTHIECHICGEIISSMIMNQHVQSHNLERFNSPICEICSRAFTSMQFLASHQMDEHNVINEYEKEMAYRCPHCKCELHNTQSFIAHVATHTGVYPFECSICKQGYLFKTVLKLHMQKHSDGKCVESVSLKPKDCSDTICIDDDYDQPASNVPYDGHQFKHLNISQVGSYPHFGNDNGWQYGEETSPAFNIETSVNDKRTFHHGRQVDTIDLTSLQDYNLQDNSEYFAELSRIISTQKENDYSGSVNSTYSTDAYDRIWNINTVENLRQPQVTFNEPPVINSSLQHSPCNDLPRHESSQYYNSAFHGTPEDFHNNSQLVYIDTINHQHIGFDTIHHQITHDTIRSTHAEVQQATHADIHRTIIDDPTYCGVSQDDAILFSSSTSMHDIAHQHVAKLGTVHHRNLYDGTVQLGSDNSVHQSQQPFYYGDRFQQWSNHIPLPLVCDKFQQDNEGFQQNIPQDAIQQRVQDGYAKQMVHDEFPSQFTTTLITGHQLEVQDDAVQHDEPCTAVLRLVKDNASPQQAALDNDPHRHATIPSVAHNRIVKQQIREDYYWTLDANGSLQRYTLPEPPNQIATGHMQASDWKATLDEPSCRLQIKKATQGLPHFEEVFAKMKICN